MMVHTIPWTALGLPEDFAPTRLSLALASDDDFALDRGEVVRPDLLDRSKRPVAGGLACSAIFGEPGETDRFGHTLLNVAVVHPLLLLHARGWLSRRTGMSDVGLRQLVERQRWVVIDAATDSGVEVGSLVDDGAAYELFDEPVELATGAEAIERLLAMRGHAQTISLTRVRVLPLGVRPSGAGSDLDDLYRRVVNRAFRLRRLLELQAPEIIVRNEVVMTQQAVESLFCNEARESPTLAGRERPMQSLLGFAGGSAMMESLRELDARVASVGRAALGESLSPTQLRSIRVLQALSLELRAT